MRYVLVWDARRLIVFRESGNAKIRKNEGKICPKIQYRKLFQARFSHFPTEAAAVSPKFGQI